MTDLTFNGGKYGAFFGNQQFTTRNMTFNNCQTAIFMNWNWVSLVFGLLLWTHIFDLKWSPSVTVSNSDRISTTFGFIVSMLTRPFRRGLSLELPSITVVLVLIWPMAVHQARLWALSYSLTAQSRIPLSAFLLSTPRTKALRMERSSLIT
jgi:Pectate lyase superfamily protein